MKKLIRTSILLAAILFSALGTIRADGKKYPFVAPPTEVIEKIATLTTVSGKEINLHADEKKLLREASTGKLKSYSFAEAALIASGTVQPELRKQYLDQLDSIEKEARVALQGIESSTQRAEKLLAFLHKRVMTKGYSSTQTDLSIVLSEGRFNCVSSAVLYNVIARRLELDVQAFEIPGGAFGIGHVFSALKDDGQLIPIETTNPKGFGLQDNMKKKNKRPMNDLELVAVIYYNHGVESTQKKHHHEAILANLCALSLDRGNPSACNNAMAGLVNWERDLARAGKFTDAVEVLRVALTLAPRDSKLLQNRKALVHEIVMKVVKAEDYSAALQQIEAHRNFLNDREQARRLTLMVIDRQAQALQKKKDWSGAVNIYTEALTNLPGDSHLTNNLVVTYDSWARAHIASSDWSGAARVYEQGLTVLPRSGHLRNNLRYVQQQMKR